MKKLKYILLLFTLINYGQGVKTFFESPEGKHFISADLHIHTVFSDGSVWPTIRVDEALRDSICLLYTSPSPRDGLLSRMPSSA